MLRFIDTQEAWNGERIDGIAYPHSIATKWADAELEAIGLEKTPPPEPVDPGPPPPRREGTFREFMDLFTPSEQEAIAGAAMANVQVKLWYDRAMGGTIRLDHPDTVAGLGVLLAGGLITQTAHDAVLAADYNDGKTTRSDD